ncbi:MAG: toll/interleukin-1 receptor domain-containing protein [Gammaproteobacteria bacterium]|nr:toll/interleukin-1 receptor domain-containing protein [Gammaproteobacteria bacterium]
MPNVFISHARADEELVRRIRDHLTASGLSVWTDEDDLEPGSQWAESVDEAIGRSRNVLFLLSDHANGSHSLHTEAAIALSHGGKRLIPIRCTKRAEVPFALRPFTAMDFSNRASQQALLERLADLLHSEVPDADVEVGQGDATGERVLNLEAALLRAEKARYDQQANDADRILKSRLAGVAVLATICTATVGVVASAVPEPHTIVAAIIGVAAGLAAALVFDVIRSIRLAERSSEAP